MEERTKLNESYFQGEIENLRKLLKIENFMDIEITSAQAARTLSKLNRECLQLRIVITFPIDFKVNVEIIFRNPLMINIGDAIVLFNVILRLQEVIEELQIFVENEQAREELLTCTTFLQRKRDVRIAFAILRLYFILMSERQLILKMLTLHGGGNISHVNGKRDGMSIVYSHPKTHVKYFEIWWKIRPNLDIDAVSDCITFSLDQRLRNVIRVYLEELLKPNMIYSAKVDAWSKILTCINKFHKNGEQADSSYRVESEAILKMDSSHDLIQIADSDEEDCILIENSNT